MPLSQCHQMMKMCHSEALPKNLGLSFGVKILCGAQDDRRTAIFRVERRRSMDSEANQLEVCEQSQSIAKGGDWVEIHDLILPAGQRAPQVPADTQAVPLEMRVRGFLIEEQAARGERVSIRTRSGRIVQGTLAEGNPRYGHDFGQTQPELLAINSELRTLLAGN